ncbi:Regulatory protein LuxO [Bremerella volcania]|uniref:Regulatory protein LuxO n=1 Tax=Bremerella volcania TaxID=2527984 RepID=A0A518C9B1_9BACT|nr:sigma-54 dependent transcriptional regulator [Bremerella volcania]QDU75802.1 Regulatory protein LuxO [Bremerella volcania]
MNITEPAPSAFPCRLLLVDSDPRFRQIVTEFLSSQTVHVDQVEHEHQSLQRVDRADYDVIIFEMASVTPASLQRLRQLKERAACEVVCVSEISAAESIVEALKAGAFDYLPKPVRMSRLQKTVENAFKATRRQRQSVNGRPHNRHGKRSLMVGQSAPMQEVFRLIKRAGPTEQPILIQGESGTGKELVAKAVHQVSHRADQPMVVVNCAALPESELFGHEKGAFTGAASTKPGLFELADGGTMFIDEIGEMAGGIQAKLLRVLEDGSFRRVGGTEERRVNVRLLTATNRNLFQEVKEGRFREDLFYRIDVMRLELPPLRHRGDDIALLTHHFMGNDWQIDMDAMEAIERYHWPGNIRQLINALERAKILSDDETILLQNLPTEVAQCTSAASRSIPPRNDDLESLMRQQIEVVMSREKGNKVRAARALGVSRRSLYRLLEKYQIV